MVGAMGQESKPCLEAERPPTSISQEELGLSYTQRAMILHGFDASCPRRWELQSRCEIRLRRVMLPSSSKEIAEAITQLINRGKIESTLKKLNAGILYSLTPQGEAACQCLLQQGLTPAIIHQQGIYSSGNCSGIPLEIAVLLSISANFDYASIGWQIADYLEVPSAVIPAAAAQLIAQGLLKKEQSKWKTQPLRARMRLTMAGRESRRGLQQEIG
jgi:hypothetical protein